MVAIEGYTKSKTLRIIDDIRKFRKEPYNYTDEQIQNQLALTDRMWQRYNKKVNELDKAEWQQITRTQLEPEFLKLKASLEDTYKIANQEAQKAETTYDKMLACEKKDEARLNIVQLIKEGPDYLPETTDVPEKQTTKVANKSETKV